MFTNRSVIEVVELLFAFTVCASLLLLSAGLIVLNLVPNDVDQDSLDRAAEFVRDALTTLLAAVLGLVAGYGSRRKEEVTNG